MTMPGDGNLAVVWDAELGEELRSLLPSRSVWAVDSEANRRVAESTCANYDSDEAYEGGITLLRFTYGESAEAFFFARPSYGRRSPQRVLRSSDVALNAGDGCRTLRAGSGGARGVRRIPLRGICRGFDCERATKHAWPRKGPRDCLRDSSIVRQLIPDSAELLPGYEASVARMRATGPIPGRIYGATDNPGFRYAASGLRGDLPLRVGIAHPHA